MKRHSVFAGIFSLLLIVSVQTATGITPTEYNNSNDAYNKSKTDSALQITMTNSLNFAPDTLVIQTGQTVTWKNTSLLVHTVTADPEQATMEKSVHLPEGAEPFDSGNLKPEETFTHTFTTPGSYTYFCVPHEAMMRGTIIVKPS